MGPRPMLIRDDRERACPDGEGSAFGGYSGCHFCQANYFVETNICYFLNMLNKVWMVAMHGQTSTLCMHVQTGMLCM